MQSHHSPPLISILMPNHSLSNGYLGKIPFQILLWSMMLYGMEYSFGQFRSAVWAVSLPSLLPTPSLLAEWDREVFDSVQALFSKTLVFYQYSFSHKSKAEYHMGSYNEN